MSRQTKPYRDCTPEQKARRAANARAWRAKNQTRFRESEKLRSVQRRYGVTLADMIALGEAQSWACAICTIHLPFGFRRGKAGLHLDHDHSTGSTYTPCNCMPKWA